MVSDLLQLLQAIQSAQGAEEKARLQQELQAAIETDIRKLFGEYPNRRRTFGAIKDGLGIFDPPEKQEELKKLLFAMGARPQKGKDDTYWHLPEDHSPAPPERQKSWSSIYALSLVALLAVAAWSYFDLFSPAAPFDQPACLDAAATPEELDACQE